MTLSFFIYLMFSFFSGFLINKLEKKHGILFSTIFCFNIWVLGSIIYKALGF